MKLLENTKFCSLASELSVEAQDCRLETRLESYSCKMLSQDKRLYKGMVGCSPNEREILSPPHTDDLLCIGGHLVVNQHSPRLERSFSSDPEQEFMPELRDSISRKTLFYLTSTLNMSFTDYDFMDARGEDFSREPSIETVIQVIDNKLNPILNGRCSHLKALWSTIDQEIALKDCCVYSYTPDYASDPFSSDGAIWSFNYFLYNKNLKRIVLFTCRALSKQAAVVPEEYQTQWSMEVEEN